MTNYLQTYNPKGKKKTTSLSLLEIILLCLNKKEI